MTRRLVYAIRPMKWTKNAYEAKIEYMPGYTKTFIGKDFQWVLNEIEKAINGKVPTLSGPVRIEEGKKNGNQD